MKTIEAILRGYYKFRVFWFVEDGRFGCWKHRVFWTYGQAKAFRQGLCEEYEDVVFDGFHIFKGVRVFFQKTDCRIKPHYLATPNLIINPDMKVWVAGAEK